MVQDIKRDNELILSSKTQLVTVNTNGKPIKIPNDLEKQLNKF